MGTYLGRNHAYNTPRPGNEKVNATATWPCERFTCLPAFFVTRRTKPQAKRKRPGVMCLVVSFV